MKTIVINTSKEAKRTKLDVLFKAPFGKEELLWYGSDLSDIGEVADRIKGDLITDTDIVDRDYNLIVLVDIYSLPQGNEIHTARLYKALLTRYIGTELVKALCAYSLRPHDTAIYFADSAKFARDVDLSKLDDNAIEQEIRRNRVKEKAMVTSEVNQDDDLVDTQVPTVALKTKERSFNERMIMELFDWTEEQNKDDFRFVLKASLDGEETLDFSNSFAGATQSIEKSHITARVLDLALSEVEQIADCTDATWDTQKRVELTTVRDCLIRCLTHKFSRDNEQVWLEGFFNLFANIFHCVGSESLREAMTVYNKDDIESVLTDALKKYTHFSKEANIDAAFLPIEALWAERQAVWEKHRENAQKEMNITEADHAKAAEAIMSSAQGKGQKAVHAEGMHGLDKIFYDLVDGVFVNYDPEVIKAQNARLVKDCLEALWRWRDKDGMERLQRVVETVDDRITSKDDYRPDEEREVMAFIEKEYKEEHAQMIEDITEVEHRLHGNKNILLDTKAMVLQYTDLMRRGKKRLIAFIGAIVTLVLTMLPFVCLQLFPADEKLVPLAVTAGLGACFATLYAVAAGYYMAQIRREKCRLIDELETLKTKSEADRKESIAALHRYYTETVFRAEGLHLLWRVITERDHQNAVECIKRNNHIKRLVFLIKLVEDFRTMLKLDTEAVGGRLWDRDNADKDTAVWIAKKGLALVARESFHSPQNQRVYRVLPLQEEGKQNDGEGETTA